MAIITRNRKNTTEAIVRLTEKAGNRGLTINQNETKYIMYGRAKELKQSSLRIGNYCFETEENFKYLGVVINDKRSIETEEGIK